MNRQFYEFWGDFFTRLAQSQKQIENLAAWMEQGFAGAKEFNELLRRCYGLAPLTAGDPQSAQMWRQAMDDFQQALGQLANQWGWVSRTEHQKVLERCAALEKQVQRQQTTIKELRTLLEEKGLGHSELFQHLKGALKEQSDQFHALMESIHEAYKEKS